MITYPLNNIEYQAEDAELFHCTRTSGVWAKDDFPFSVTGNNNSITIGKGIAWINNDEFSGKVVAQNTTTTLDLGVPDSAYPRFDVVAIQFSSNANETKLVVKKGTPASSPRIPSISKTASLYELYLCKIYRPAGAAVVTASNVTDLRLDPKYCGLMADAVTSVNTEQINNQINEFIATLRDTIDDIQSGAGVMLENYWTEDGKIPVSRGGTGNSSLASNSFLVGNGTSPVRLLTPASARSSMGLGNSTGSLSVSNGGTGRNRFDQRYFIVGKGTSSLDQKSPDDARDLMSAQKKIEARTSAFGSTKLVGSYLNMQVPRSDINSEGGTISVGRYSDSFGYGFKISNTGKYLLSACVTVQLSSANNTAGGVVLLRIVNTNLSNSGNELLLSEAKFREGKGLSINQTLSIPLNLESLTSGYLYLKIDTDFSLSHLSLFDAKFTIIRLSV